MRSTKIGLLPYVTSRIAFFTATLRLFIRGSRVPFPGAASLQFLQAPPRHPKRRVQSTGCHRADRHVGSSDLASGPGLVRRGKGRAGSDLYCISRAVSGLPWQVPCCRRGVCRARPADFMSAVTCSLSNGFLARCSFCNAILADDEGGSGRAEGKVVLFPVTRRAVPAGSSLPH